MAAGDRDYTPLKIIYITSTLPYGHQEAFLIPEIAHLLAAGHDVTILPIRPRGGIVHTDAAPLASVAVRQSLLTMSIARAALTELGESPRQTVRAFLQLLRSRNAQMMLKNIAVFPKALWIGRLARRTKADHLHAHWASTSATASLVASITSGTSWSFTAHRWDITENNLLATKAASAAFIRAISRRGAAALQPHLPPGAREVEVIHIGVDISDEAPEAPSGRGFRIGVVADLVEVKGHRYMLDAISMMRDRGSSIHLELAGDGPLRAGLERQVTEAGLEAQVAFLGTLSHASILESLQRRRWDVVVLPSIRTDAAEEGIPVSLMEAMAAGIPVIATRTGAISELVGESEGILVDGSDAAALADALERLEGDKALRASLGKAGRGRVMDEFDVTAITSKLVDRFNGLVEP